MLYNFWILGSKYHQHWKTAAQKYKDSFLILKLKTMSDELKNLKAGIDDLNSILSEFDSRLLEKK